eukprot:5366110-Amphidinium_carterae.1
MQFSVGVGESVSELLRRVKRECSHKLGHVDTDDLDLKWDGQAVPVDEKVPAGSSKDKPLLINFEEPAAPNAASMPQ